MRKQYSEMLWQSIEIDLQECALRNTRGSLFHTLEVKIGAKTNETTGYQHLKMLLNHIERCRFYAP